MASNIYDGFRINGNKEAQKIHTTLWLNGIKKKKQPVHKT